MSEKTRQRVTAAAEELGYTPSALARALVTRNSRIIGVIVGDIVDPYFGEIARGVADVAGRAGYLSMVCNADRQADIELEHVLALRDYHAAGIVFAGSGHEDGMETGVLADAVATASEAGSIVIAVAPRGFESQRIVFDNRQAGFDITDYLISIGHRRISFVSGDPGLIGSTLRRQGYEEAIEGAGLVPEVVSGAFDYETGFEIGARLAAAGDLPDGIVGANDEVAIGVLTGLRQGDVDVPGQVSVTGIGGLRPSRYLGLTTISAPTYEMGVAAAEAIIAGHDADNPPVNRVLPHEITPRSTTRPRP